MSIHRPGKVGAIVVIACTLATAFLGLGAVNAFRRQIIEVDQYIDAAAYKQGGVTYDLSEINAATTKLAGIENGATADQTDEEIETAYNNRVAVVSQVDAEAGTSTTAYRWTPQRVAQAIAALETGGGGGAEFTSDVFRIQDSLDATKELAFDVSAIPTGTTRTITVPNANVNLGQLFPVTGTPDGTKFLRDDLAWATPAGGGTVTSVAVAGTDGLEVDSGSPITGSGTITLGVNATSLRTHLGVEAGATADQSDAEIETAYNNQVAVVAQVDAEAGTSTTVYRWTPERVKQAIDALAPSASGGPEFGTDVFRLNDATDGSKQIAFDASAITGSTVRTLSMPDANVDLGNITDDLVSNTLTASKFVGSGSTSDAVDLGTAEVEGTLALTHLPTQAQRTVLGRGVSAGTGTPTALTMGDVLAILHTPTALSSSGGSVAWTVTDNIQFAITLSEATTIAAPSGTATDGRLVWFIITQDAVTPRTLAWNAVFVAMDGLNASIPAVSSTAGEITMYGFRYFSGLSKYVLMVSSTYTG